MTATLTRSATSTLIDAEIDCLIPIRTLTRDRLGKAVSPATQWRWLRKGCRGVRLEAVQVCGVWHTTPAAFGAFVNGQTAAALGNDANPATPVARSPEKTAKLRAAGLLRK